MNFVEKYPFALFMNEEQLDYSAAKVRAGVDINVAMIGFGKTNRQIFLTSVANNQFITEREGRTELKKVHYHIFDKNPAENNKNLNHSYYRYKQEREGYDADAYLPLPSLPADESYHKLDVNDTRFYNVLHDAFTSEKNSVNFAVIAFGSDLENIDFAQKLLDKRAEWGVKNLIVFVKTRKDHKDLAVLNAPGCYAIGNERECVFDIREIVGDSIYRMARLRNAVYDVEYIVTCGEVSSPLRIWSRRARRRRTGSGTPCARSLKGSPAFIAVSACGQSSISWGWTACPRGRGADARSPKRSISRGTPKVICRTLTPTEWKWTAKRWCTTTSISSHLCAPTSPCTSI